ncbi:MAG: glycosyltransferase, partial [Pseudomonadota bacterium]|nr:glycosyltransferase [Pseudomonadota bacterium]
MKIMQTMAGGQFGGAEEFFLRLVAAFNARGVSQSVVVRPNKARGRKLRDVGVNLVELPFGKWFDFQTQPSLTAQIDRVRPDIVLSWMNRAT